MPKLCWYDQIGNRWEKEGVAAGRIFESHIQLPDFNRGLMVETTSSVPEGKPPKTNLEIKRVLLRTLSGKEVELDRSHPTIKNYFKVISHSLC